MINIFKELKIVLPKSIKFLIRTLKRKDMLAFCISLFIVFFCLIDVLCKSTFSVNCVVLFSSTVALTCIFLYIFDFVNGIKNWINRPKVYSQAVRATVGIPKKR